MPDPIPNAVGPIGMPFIVVMPGVAALLVAVSAIGRAGAGGTAGISIPAIGAADAGASAGAGVGAGAALISIPGIASGMGFGAGAGRGAARRGVGFAGDVGLAAGFDLALGVAVFIPGMPGIDCATAGNGNAAAASTIIKLVRSFMRRL